MGGANRSGHQYSACHIRPGQQPDFQPGGAIAAGDSCSCALVDDRQQSPAARQSRRPGAVHTRNRSFAVDWNQVTGIRRIAAFTIIKTRTGWFAMMSGKEDPITLEMTNRKEKLLTFDRRL